MGKSITAKYENCVEVSIQDMFDLANDNDLKDLTQKCKNEPDKTKRRNVKRTMPIFYPAYPVHDCLIVKASDKDKAMQVFRDTVRSYILNHTKNTIDLTIAISVEDITKKRREKGYYS